MSLAHLPKDEYKQETSITKIGIINSKNKQFSEEEVQKIADELLLYSEREDTFTIEDFFLDKRMHPQDIREIAYKYECLHQAMSFAIQKFKQKWIKKGAYKDSDFREGFVKFYLSANFGMKEHTAVSSDGQLTINVKDHQ